MFFIIILSRRIGYGIALLLNILGGILGNFCSIYLHKMSVASIGYSTALFATIGILCGFQAGNQFNSKSIFFIPGYGVLHYWLYWERAMKGQIMQLISVD